MKRVVTIVALVLLAQSLNDGQSRRAAPEPSGAHVDRHIDAHIAPRESSPAASPGERTTRDAPEPAIGTGAPPEPPPSANQMYRDRLYRGRR